MSFIDLLIYVFLGLLNFVILFILRNKFNISRLYNAIFSVFLLLIYASIFSNYNYLELNDNIFLTFIFQFVFDFIYTTYILEEDFFNNKESNTIYYVCLIIVGLFINNSFISKVNYVFLTGEEIRFLIWTFLLVFIYNFIKENKILSRGYNTEKFLDEGSVLVVFTKLRRRYLNDIRVNDLQLELAIYAIMIYYNHKRSAFFRGIDNFIFRLNGKKRRLGIMQVESNSYINDIESINITIREFKKVLGKKSGAGSIEASISKYMGEDNLEVLSIYNTLKNFFKI